MIAADRRAVDSVGSLRRLAASAGEPPLRHVCDACPHACKLGMGQTGLCHARVGGEDCVVSESFGRITALALDPIEKKPLAHYQPGTTVLSIGSYGCNLECPWCQNARISCATAQDVPWTPMTPQQLVKQALELRHQGCIGLAYTYNEPLIAPEFLEECMRLAHDVGLKNVLVSNGMATERQLEWLTPLIDAANIDLKGFSPETYRICHGNLTAVKATIQALAQAAACHLEITWLVVPGVTDDLQEFHSAVAWIASLDPDIPLHVTRFFPRHKMSDAAPTPVGTVHAFADEARKLLSRVQVGNC